MNPHFIFNSLNSIKSFIISNDVKSSVIYFSKFAKLLRYNLNNSTIHFVNLTKEIDFLKDYVSLENLRLTNPFEFIIESTNGLDIELLKVPPLIIQPFIENAIWHGLSLKKKNGLLRLKIVTLNNFLEIHIIDNGIGRKASKLINKDKIHSSKGISITSKRLTIFSKIYKLKKSFKIIDLKDVNGNDIGTEVIIKLPLVYKNDIDKIVLD
jgi:LytS/YehU family sensor histidine kinase